MKRLAMILAAVLACAAFADEGETVVTNYVSNTVSVRGWKRTFVLGKEGGGVADPTGQIAEYMQGAALIAGAQAVDEIVAGAQQGLTNALNELYAVTNNINHFTDRVYIAGDLEASATRSNLWCYVPKMHYDADTGVDTFWVWYSQELAQPPRMAWRYRTETGTYTASGVWEATTDEEWGSMVYTVNGFAGCRKYMVARPAGVGKIVLNLHGYPRFGNGDFDFGNNGFFVDGELPFTGYWENAEGKMERYVNGLYVGDEDKPYAYRVQYITGDGESYIDTGIVGNLATAYQLRFTSKDKQIVFGSRVSATSCACTTFANSQLVTDFGSYADTRIATNAAPVEGQRFTAYNSATSRYMEHEASGLRISATSAYTRAFTTPSNLFIGYAGAGTFPSGTANYTGNIYYCKIWDNGTLVRDYIPVVDWEGVAAMYDREHNTMYYNAGTGAFTAGDRWVSDDYAYEVEYLESTGQGSLNTSTSNAMWIDTGYVPVSSTRVVCRMAITTLQYGTNKEELFGATLPRFAWGFASVSPYQNFYVGLGAQNLTTTVPRDTNVHTWEIDASTKTWAIDEVSGSFTSAGDTLPSVSLYLFARHYDADGDVANRPADAKIYYCKIYEGSRLVHHFLPVVDYDIVPCMYDKVTRTRFYNQGTGSFTAGPRKE